MKKSTSKYQIEKDILSAFNLSKKPVATDYNVDKMIEDMCVANDDTQLHIIGIFLLLCLQGEEKSIEPFNLSWFAYSLLPLPNSASSHFQQEIGFKRMSSINCPNKKKILVLFVTNGNAPARSSWDLTPYQTAGLAKPGSTWRIIETGAMLQYYEGKVSADGTLVSYDYEEPVASARSAHSATPSHVLHMVHN